VCTSHVGPAAWKLRPDLTKHIATHSSFPFCGWPWPFVTKITETRAVRRAKVMKKCRFLRTRDIDREMKNGYADARISFWSMR
jgi:hypothetical protein